MKTSDDNDSSAAAVSHSIKPPQIVIDDNDYEGDEYDDPINHSKRKSSSRQSRHSRNSSRSKSRNHSQSRNRGKELQYQKSVPEKEVKIKKRPGRGSSNLSLLQKPKVGKPSIKTSGRKESMGLTGTILPKNQLLPAKTQEDQSLGVDLNISELDSLEPLEKKRVVAQKRTTIVILPTGVVENQSSSSSQG